MNRRGFIGRIIAGVAALAAGVGLREKRIVVDSATGNDSNTGSDSDPLATIAEAFRRCESGGIVVCKPGHTEMLYEVVTMPPNSELHGGNFAFGDIRPLVRYVKGDA